MKSLVNQYVYLSCLLSSAMMMVRADFDNPLDEDIGMPDVIPGRQKDCANTMIQLPDSVIILEDQIRNGSAQQSRSRPQQIITIDTYFHIVSTVSKQSDITDATVQLQLDAMNDAYRNTTFRFRNAGTTRTVRGRWARGLTAAADVAMKRALRRGDYKSLNLYFQSDW